MGSIWKMGRSADRENLSRGDARFFVLCPFVSQTKKNGFPAAGRFKQIGHFLSTQVFPRIGPEVTVGCLGVVSTHYNPIWTLPGPKSPKNLYNKIPIKFPLKLFYSLYRAAYPGASYD